MFSPNSFYDYLRYYFNINKKNISIRTFNNPGDNNLLNTAALLNNKLTPYLEITKIINSNKGYNLEILKYHGYCEMFDQEPVDIDAIYNASTKNIYNDLYNMSINDDYKHDINDINNINLRLNILSQITSPINFILYMSASVRLPLVCHSEKNSNNINTLSKYNFIPIHYWYHAYISLDWFKQYKYLTINSNTTKHRFGIYIRDASGTRTYRISLIDKLSSINNDIYFKFNEPFITQIKKQNKSNLLSKWNTNKTSISSKSSAFIDWPDINIFDIQIIPETLFDTEKTHLTEKSLKPIAMGQPFIIVGCPHSLEYLRSYGFKTFNNLWDESYDTEVSSTIRFEKIINLIHNVVNLSPSEYLKMFNEAKKIAIYNRKHFYSEKFEQHLINELHYELSNAFGIRNEMYYKIPGGTYFYIMNKFHKKGILSEHSYQSIKNMMKYINTHHKDIATQIIKKYNHLL